MAAIAAVLLTGRLAMAVTNLTFSVQAVDVIPSNQLETATPFTLSMYVTNNSASTIQYTGFDVGLQFSPNIPEGDVKLDGSGSPSGSVEVIPAGGSFFAFPGDEEFLIDTWSIDWSRGSALSITAGTTQELARMYLLLEPGSDLAKWNITFDTEFTTLTNGAGPAVPTNTMAFTGGYIATPEPSVTALLALGGLGLLRRRRA